nr:MAG TPA: hypothetical protein [Caudoviricetes sp.]
MIKIENTEVMGWEAAIRGMRNPMNSWAKSDSIFVGDGEYHDICGNSGPYNGTVTDTETFFEMGDNDLDLMKNLAKAGADHRKFMRMITVYVDIIAPLYWWKEFDTYKVGTVANSCSTMHKIAAKEFTLEDFSIEHLYSGTLPTFKAVLTELNCHRNGYLITKDEEDWWQMIQLLPSSYNQRRTVMLNYEVLANIYKSRRNHKLDEWRTFCEWIESLPYLELITGKI